MTRLRRIDPAVWAVPLLAVVAYPLYGRGFVNTDAMWSLAWGRQIALGGQRRWKTSRRGGELSRSFP